MLSVIVVPVRIVVDANWYISACISRNSRQILYYRILKNPFLEVYYSAELLKEFEEVMSRDKFSKYIRREQISRFKSLMFNRANKVVIIGTTPKVVRDHKDDYLLGICEGCLADFLITGDKDLLILENYNQTRMISMHDFLEVLPELI